MRKTILIILIVFLGKSSFLFSQEINLSNYRETKLNEGLKYNDNYLYKTYVHFGGSSNALYGNIYGVSDDTLGVDFRYNGQLPLLQKGQVVIIYYKGYIHNSNYNSPVVGEIYHIELVSNHFIVGNNYYVLENLRLRVGPSVGNDTILTIQSYHTVIVLEEQQKEVTINNITSKWVRVQYRDSAGWCFGGYICNGRQGQDWVEPPKSLRN
jgi:hypothetical protein